MRVAQIDPGHGGSNNGARGHGIIEERYALRMARSVKAWMGDDCRLTREDDSTIDYSDRAKLTGTNAVWCLHNNASKNPKARGFHVYVLPGDKVGRLIAKKLIGYLPPEILNPRIIEAKWSLGRWIRNARYLLSVYKGPTVLVEMLFVSNDQDAALLKNEKVKDGIAQAIAKSAKDWIDGTL